MPGLLQTRCWLLLAVLGAALFGSSFANAQEPLAIESAVAGFGGVYKAGYWTQILVELKAGPKGAKGLLNLLTEDGDGVPVIFPGDVDAPLDLAAGEVATVRLYAKAGPQRSGWQLQLRDTPDDPVRWSQRLDVPPPQRATRELLVTIGAAENAPIAAGLIKRPEDVTLIVAPVAKANELPDRVWGYEGVERVLLIAGKQSLVDELKPEQLVALDQWVRLGGKLILSIGARAPELLEPSHPLAALAPGKFESLEPMRGASGLSVFSQSQFPRNSLTDENRPPVVRLSERTGRVEAVQGVDPTLPPLVVRSAYGFGQVTFVAFDLDQSVFTGWNGYNQLLAGLLELGGPKATNLAAAQNRSLTHLGYDDLVGQLRAALDQFPGVTVVSFTAVAMVAIALLLLIGPADFFLLQYLKVPRSVTWFTFPLICLLFAVGTWYLGRLAHGTHTRVNQLEVVDVDARSGAVRGTLWSHIYSPEGRNLQLSLQVAGRGKTWEVVQGTADWQGLPGSGLGGLASPQVALNATHPYLISPPGRVAVINSLPIRTASSKALSGRWWAQTKITKDVPALRTNDHGHLQGELSNPLPVKLVDIYVASGEWLYKIESLQPGQKLEAGSLIPYNLDSRLTRRTVVDSKDLSTPWQSDDTDLQRIVQMLMLHNAVKGPTYTGMSHRYQPQLDLTGHLALSRALMWGRAEAPAATMQLADVAPETMQTQNWIWYRVIIPVQARESTLAAQP